MKEMTNACAFFFWKWRKEGGGDESEGRRKGEMTLRLTFSALSTSVVVAQGFRTFLNLLID